MTRLEDLTEQAILGLRSALDSRGNHRLVMVCDPALDDPLDEQIIQLGLLKYAIHMRSWAKAPEPYLTEAPYELRFESFVHHSLRTAIRQAIEACPWNQRSRSICAWLMTDRPLPALAKEMRERAHCQDEHGRSRIFRFWDPRTAQHHQALFPGQAPCSFLQDTTWAYIDSFGSWRLLPAPAAPGWTAPGIRILREWSLINGAFQYWTRQGVDPQAGPEAWATIREALDIGRAVGLADDEDLMRFAADRLQCHAPIERSPCLAELLTWVKQGKGHYSRLVADYDREDWQRICQAIPGPAQQSQGQAP